MWNDPEVFGGFLLVQRLAESAMATVHLAVRLGDVTGRPIVLKRPPLGERPSGRPAQAILREAEVLSEVRGAGIPALEAAGDIAGLPYVAIERLRGASLAKVLAPSAPLPIPAVRALGKDVARALARLHEAGWVHRDVTPSNIFVDDAGDVYLLDFGLAARAGDERSAVVEGTRGYAPPEVAVPGSAHPARDVYGLAVCLAEAALGRRVFDEASLVEAAGRGDAPPSVAALEPHLPGITAALRRDPSARPSAAELAGSLGEGTDRSALVARVAAAQAAPPSSGTPALPAAEVPAAGGAPVEPAPVRITLPDPISGAPQQGGATSRHAGATLSQAGSQQGASRSAVALTPTAAMPAVVERDSGVLPTLRDAALGSAPVSSAQPSRPAATVSRPPASVRAPARARGGLSTALLAVALLLGALVMGFVAGRATSRPRGGSLAISGALPKRTEVLLDGKKLTFADGVPLPVSPGQHTLTLSSARAGKREIPFSVRPGEHVVIVSPARAAGTPGPDDDGP